jgi:hypothetical protein
MSGPDAERAQPFKDKLEEIGRRLAEERSREDLQDIQLELSVLERWDRMMLKSHDAGGHHHDHDDVPDVIDMGEVDPDVIDMGEVDQ